MSNRRYAHKECYEKNQKNSEKQELDKQKLLEYLEIKFHNISNNTKIKAQLKDYINNKNFTYSGIYKTLYYFYDIKKNPIDKANNGIGIVPYIYKEAHDYYYNLWLAQQRNENKQIKDYIPQIEKVHILVPQRNIIKKSYFQFLDEEV